MIFETVRDIISEQFELPKEQITEETTLTDLNADSLDVVELAVSIEDAFSLGEIDSDELSNIRTVGDLVAYVTSAKG